MVLFVHASFTEMSPFSVLGRSQTRNEPFWDEFLEQFHQPWVFCVCFSPKWPFLCVFFLLFTESEPFLCVFVRSYTINEPFGGFFGATHEPFCVCFYQPWPSLCVYLSCLPPKTSPLCAFVCALSPKFTSFVRGFVVLFTENEPFLWGVGRFLPKCAFFCGFFKLLLAKNELVFVSLLCFFGQIWVCFEWLPCSFK